MRKDEGLFRPRRLGAGLRRLALAFCLAATGGLASCQTTAPLPGLAAPTPESPISASGFLEATDVSIVPEVSAQITSLTVEEGDAVKAGQTLVALDDSLVQAQKSQAEAALLAAQVVLTQTLAGPRPEAVAAAAADLEHAQAAAIGARQAITDARAILYRPPGLAEQIAQAQTQVALAEQDVQKALADATDEGFVRGATKDGTRARAIEDQKLAAADANTAAAQAELAGAKNYLAELQKVSQAPVDLIANVHAAQSWAKVAAATVTMTQSSLAVAQATATPEEIAQAAANVQVAAANVALIDAQLKEFQLDTPLSGVVTQKLAHAGEVSKPGQPMVVISDLSQLTLKVYIAESQIGRIGMGQPVAVTVDAYPGVVFTGVVSRIASQAEFTPSNVQTKDDRSKLVFAVKIALPNADGRLKAGMPADAVFQTP
jgi:HlyD family secretion protein